MHVFSFNSHSDFAPVYFLYFLMNVCQSPVHECVMCVCVSLHVVNGWLQSFLLLDMTHPL